jgi:hypothetical protein
MYKIIGTDQKEYGPVTSDQITQWIAQGRVNAQTKAQAAGGEWKTLGDFPEFSATLSHRVPPVYPSTPPHKTSGLAIASLVLGIFGLFTCGISAVVGLIFGIVAMSQIKNSNGALGGHVLALVGTIFSGIFILMIPIDAALLLPALSHAKQRAQAIQCVNNMKQLALAVRGYSGDHDGHFPPAATWCDAIRPSVESDRVFRCPAGNENERCHYAYNSRLDGMDDKDIDPDTVLFFETEGGWNISGGPELMLNNSRHRAVFVVAFADGHVEQMTASSLAGLRWTP